MVARGRHPQYAQLRKRYDEFVQLQGGDFCFLCGREPKTRRLHIDHDHKTNEVRGLLCHLCNRFLRSDPLWHDRAAMYLRNPPLCQDAGRLPNLEIVEHKLDSVLHDGEAWKAICTCGWECWDQPSRGAAASLVNSHALSEELPNLEIE